MPDAWIVQGQLPDGAGVEDLVKAWRDLRSAGHGVPVIDDVPPVAELVDRLERKCRAACGRGAFGR